MCLPETSAEAASFLQAPQSLGMFALYVTSVAERVWKSLCCSQMVAMGTSAPSDYLLSLQITLNQETERYKGTVATCSGENCDSLCDIFASVATHFSEHCLRFLFSRFPPELGNDINL